MGISRIADLSSFLDIDFKVVSIIRTNIDKHQNSQTQGVGRNILEATSTGLVECYERYCGSYIIDKHIYSYEDNFSSLFVELRSLGYKDCNHAKYNLKWTKAYSILDKEDKYLPAVEVFFPYTGTDIKFTDIRPHTSGLSAGGSLIESSVYSIIEVIERYYISNFYRTFLRQKVADLINIDSIQCQKIRSILSELQTYGCDFFILKLKAIIPVYYCAIFDGFGLGPKFMVSGSGAHYQEEKALESAVLEGVQSLYTALQGSREDIVRHKENYKKQNFTNDNVYFKLKKFFSSRYHVIDFQSNQLDFKNISGIYDYLIDLLNEQDFKHIYIANLSQKDIPLFVTKAVIPKLFDSYVNPGRIT